MKRKYLYFVFLIITILFYIFYKTKFVRNFSSFNKNNELKSFIFIGDSGTGNKLQRKVAESIKKYCNNYNCVFGFIVGDVIYDNGVSSIDDIQFKTKFEDIYSQLNFPFYIVLGNHDYLGCIDCYKKYSKISTKFNFPDLYYLIVKDNIAFFVINTEDFNLNQQNWLKDNLLKNKSKYKIVIGHKPIITYESTHYSENWQNKDDLIDILCRNKIIFYISGHSHSLEHIRYIDKNRNCEINQLITGGGGAIPREKISNAKSDFYLQDNGFLVIEKNNQNLDFKFFDFKKVYSLKIN